MKWDIKDARKEKTTTFEQARVGDLVIDEDGDMFFIVEDREDGYTMIQINDGAFNTFTNFDSIRELLQDHDEFYGIIEIVPAEKISITIS